MIQSRQQIPGWSIAHLAYGRQGPFAARPGFDPITQARKRFMSLNGFPDGLPVRTGTPVSTWPPECRPCNAILLALFDRDGSAAASMSRSRCSNRGGLTGFFTAWTI